MKRLMVRPCAHPTMPITFAMRNALRKPTQYFFKWMNWQYFESFGMADVMANPAGAISPPPNMSRSCAGRASTRTSPGSWSRGHSVRRARRDTEPWRSVERTRHESRGRHRGALTPACPGRAAMSLRGLFMMQYMVPGQGAMPMVATYSRSTHGASVMQASAREYGRVGRGHAVCRQGGGLVERRG